MRASGDATPPSPCIDPHMRRTAGYALIVLALACGTAGSSKKSPEATAGGEPDPAPPAAAQSGPIETRDQLAAKALARLPDIQRGVAHLRGLAFAHPVVGQQQSTADFRKFVQAEIARELPPAKSKALSAALFHLGLLRQPIDLARVTEDAVVSQAGAYYDPERKKFFLVMVPRQELMLDTISSHELVHALQDQQIGLQHYYKGHDGDGPPTINEDEINARRFVIEGDATLVMMAYAAYAMTKQNLLEPRFLPALRPQIDRLARLSVDELKAMSRDQAKTYANMGDEIQAAIDAMDQIPPIILVPLLESYTKGAMPVLEAFAQGGWDAVAELYRHPPTSTEQVLHPATKLVPKRDHPVALDIPAPAGWDLLYSEVLGELGWRVYFMHWGPSQAKAATEGWDGDRYAVYEKNGQRLGLIATTWDSPADAREFADAYAASLVVRFAGAQPADSSAGMTAFRRPDGTWIVIKVAGSDVHIVDGAEDKASLRLLSRVKKTRVPGDQ
jgi:hypothetical protein